MVLLCNLSPWGIDWPYMSALCETETKTCNTLVLPARPITPWSHKQDQEQDWEQDSLKFKTKTEATIHLVS